MTPKWIISVLLVFSVTLSYVFVSAEELARRVVLVVHSSSPLERPTASELRRLFLGVHLKIAGQELLSAINKSDSQLSEIFFQNVIYMTASNYKRQLLRRAVKFGDAAPVEYSEVDTLETALTKNKSLVSFLWADDLLQLTSLREVQTLWQSHY